MEFGLLHQGDLPGHYRYVNSALALIIVALLAYRYSRINAQQVQILNRLNQDLQKKHLLTQQLMRELNHRVKNNLQLISSLFNLQARSTTNQETSDALGEARNRINSIAILHQKLYQDDLVFEVEVSQYIDNLCEYLRQSVSIEKQFTLRWSCPTCVLQIKDTIYVGLILNELVINSIKHGSQSGVGLSVEVALRLDTVDNSSIPTQRLTLEVIDNGPGFSFAPLRKIDETFGLSLVETIVEQYDGTLQIDREPKNGARVSASLLLHHP